MITFKAIVIPGNRRKDGTYPVVIRVTFAGKSRRLPTTLVCGPEDLTRSLKIKNADILDKAEDLIREMRETIRDLSLFELETKDVDWVVRHIKDKLSVKSFALDYFKFAETVLAEKAPQTARQYLNALHAFARFLGRDRIDINDIRKGQLLEFKEWVDKTPCSYYSTRKGEWLQRSDGKHSAFLSTYHLQKLAYIYDAAKLKYNDEDSGIIRIPRSPFVGIPKAVAVWEGQASVGREVMQRMISDKPSDPRMRWALDIFILSFCLMGANMADLWEAEKFSGDVWVYNRRKVRTRRTDKAEMHVTIPPEARPFIERLKAQRGPYWLGLHDASNSLPACSIRVAKLLASWCQDNHVDRFTFYAARHTWATLARQECHVDKSTIDDCLGHKGDYNLADVYAEKAWGLIAETNAKVLALFSWE